MGDNIIYAEAAFLWVQNLASNELGIDINRIFLGGHSQGGYLVTRLNTMHRVDGVIANCPGPLDMRYRCRLEEEGTMESSNQCRQLWETYGSTVDNPEPYDAISLLNFTSGYKSPFLIVQGMEDADIQLHSWPIFKEEINRCSDCSSIEVVEAPQVGHPGLFESSTAIEAFNDLHIAAFMDIEKTTGSLQHILEYKKEVANRMLRTSDKKEFELLAEALKHAESLIKKVLGMCL